MTRLLQAGWETGDAGQIGAGAVGTSGGTAPAVVATTPVARSGAYCLKCLIAPNNSASGFGAWFSRQTIAHASQTEVWYAFGFYYTHASEPASPNYVFAHVVDAAGGNVNVVLTVDSGTVRAYVATAGTTAPTTANVTLLGTASATITGSAWHLVEVRLIASTGTGGTCEVYLDGTPVINATAARTAQTSATYGALVLGVCNWGAASLSLTQSHAFDDLRVNSIAGTVNNGRPGDETIRLLIPNAAGDLTQLARGGTDSGTNYGQVDETPPNGTTDYVFSSTVGQTDLYQLPTVAVASVSAVSVLAQAFNSDGGGGQINLVTKTGGGQSDGAGQTITSTPTYYTRLLETDAADGGAWTQVKIDALQVGVKVA